MFVLSWKNCGASKYSSIEEVRYEIEIFLFYFFLGFRMARMSTFLRSLIHFRWVTTKEYDRIMAVRRFWFDLFEKIHFSSEKVNFNLKNFDLFHTGIKNIDGSLYKIASNCLNVFYYVLYITFQAYLFALQKRIFLFMRYHCIIFRHIFTVSLVKKKKRERIFYRSNVWLWWSFISIQNTTNKKSVWGGLK